MDLDVPAGLPRPGTADPVRVPLAGMRVAVVGPALATLLIVPADAVMSHDMLHGVKKRAESPVSTIAS